MAQAVRALTGAAGAPAFEDVRFERPVVIPAGERTAVRVAALADDARSGRVVLRSGRTGFAVDHFTARWHLDEVRDGVRATPALPPLVAADGSGAGLDPGALYGTLLFQSGRFRRLLRYERLSATECHAVIEAREPVGWFGAFLPPELVLGDPGAHDAALHALQACVPHARVVPVGADGVLLRPGAPGPRHVHARERERGPGSFTFDVAVRDATGALLERWDGLRLRAVAPVTPAGPWPEALLATYLERRLERLDRSLRVAVGPRGETARRGRSDAAIRRALGAPVAVRRRADGRPEVDGGRGVSTAHADGMTLAVAGAAPVACDVEAALPRPPDVWRDLLGPERGALSETIAAARGEDVSTAATRVWAAGECLQKIGLPAGAPLTVAADADDGWLLLACGDRSVATYVTRVSGFAAPVAVAVLAGGPDARL
jgi:enediyne polyketide synthase